MKIGHKRQKLTNWPPLEEVENLRWSNNHTEYKSIAYGFCEAQDCCEVCDSRMRMLCKAKRWIDGIRLRIIKRHYGIKNGWCSGMTEREDTIERIETVLKLTHKKSITVTIPRLTAERAVSLLKEHEGLLGIQQTADGITFISTGTAQQGEERGILLGKSLMHEWIYKELLYKGLLTDDIRSVFERAKRIP